MVERRHADYMRHVSEAPDAEPERAPAHLSRAWLQPSEGGEDLRWAMTLEQGVHAATNHDGEFDDLITAARKAGIEEFFVWSRRRAEFVQFTAQTVKVAD